MEGGESAATLYDIKGILHLWLFSQKYDYHIMQINSE